MNLEISHENLMPEALLRSGLEVALHDLCISMTREDVLIEFQSAGDS